MDSRMRLLDAALNRAVEGIRTLEDLARFVLDDRTQSESLKTLRHRLDAASSSLVRQQRLEARDAACDVGKEMTVHESMGRRDLADVAAAAAARAQQALRSVEEVSKTLNPIQDDGNREHERKDVAGKTLQLSVVAEDCRYRLYDLAASIELKLARKTDAIKMAKVYVLIGVESSLEQFDDQLEKLIQADVDVIQLRDKTASDRELIERAHRLVDVCRKNHVLSMINDRPDIALLSGADGVHVGQDELTPSDVRQIVGGGVLIGLSTHSVDQVQQANADPNVDYLGCGPLFPSTTKSFDNHLGSDWLSKAAAETQKPIAAIGGINRSNIPSVIESISPGSDHWMIVMGGAWKQESDFAGLVREVKQSSTNGS